MKRILMTGFAVFTLAFVAVGCATGGGQSPESMIQATLDSWKAAITAKDIDAIMKNYSEKFENYDWGNKAGAQEFLKGAIDQGYLDDIKIVTDALEIKVEGDTATAGPIDMEGAFGEVSFDLSFAKEEGGWLIVGTESSGV
ncbi:MAG: nuclear transport factor 2 family protein [Candidatus Hydrogenedentes bacterium]|nr:nuclear transport factor 2 family protein [Candidatus Hydrogenedentota bacterium]